MLDTVRADHLGFYGHQRDTSPNFDRLARQSLACRWAFSAAPWTPPSVATMFTGLYPAAHGHMPPARREDALSGSRKLSAGHTTLAEVLRARGYRTAAVSTNPWITPLFGFDQGFETFEVPLRQPAAVVVDAGIALTEGFQRDRVPFLLYLHFLDPHDPYEPPVGYRALDPPELERAAGAYSRGMQRSMRAYDGEIRYLDDQLGRFLAFLERSGLYDEALLVVVADHGEQFREHGALRHGNALYNEEVRVPFLVRDAYSGRVGEVVESVVSTVDLFATVLDRLAVAPPAAQADGLSLFAAEAISRRSGVLSEIRRVSDQRAFIARDRRKALFAVPFEGGSWDSPRLVGLFDLDTDAHEGRPVADPASAARLQAALADAFRLVARPPRPDAFLPGAEISAETRAELRALGYIR